MRILPDLKVAAGLILLQLVHTHCYCLKLIQWSASGIIRRRLCGPWRGNGDYPYLRVLNESALQLNVLLIAYRGDPFSQWSQRPA